MRRKLASARRSVCSKVSLQAYCKPPWGTTGMVVLSDISEHGCRIRLANTPLATGARVIIRTAALLGASGTVRWAENSMVGIEFDRPLPASLLRHLDSQRASGTKLIIPSQQSPKNQRNLEHA